MLKLNKIYNMDCIEGMKQIDDNSIDSIITDPPYELGFMGKSWDNTGIANNVELWKEAYRILKPGGYLLSFGGTRTYHRMASAIEDAGFEIRDMINWCYGSGFPKSLNIGKAVDKLQGNEREELGFREDFVKRVRKNGVESKYYIMAGGWKADPTEVGKITKGNSEWEGWGTALKPAHEPICMARKPLSERTVVENVLKYGTGGINIDDSRIEIDKSKETDGRVGTDEVRGEKKGLNSTSIFGCTEKGVQMYKKQGRFPANLIHDNSEEVRECFPETKSGKAGIRTSDGFNDGIYGKGMGIKAGQSNGEFGDSGNSSRFFKSCEFEIEDAPSFIYIAKASKGERNKGCEDLNPKNVNDGRTSSIDNAFQRGDTLRTNTHPTVKPIKLMEYLVKLVTRKDGIVLDPFIGSGTTAVACAKLNRKFIGFEKEKEYIEIINARLKPILEQTRLFKVE